MRCLQRGLRHARGKEGQTTSTLTPKPKALTPHTPDPTDTSLALLDRLTRLDQARRALELELIREQDGQEAEVHKAHQHLLRVMDEVGLTVAF